MAEAGQSQSSSVRCYLTRTCSRSEAGQAPENDKMKPERSKALLIEGIWFPGHGVGPHVFDILFQWQPAAPHVPGVLQVEQGGIPGLVGQRCSAEVPPESVRGFPRNACLPSPGHAARVRAAGRTRFQPELPSAESSVPIAAASRSSRCW